MVVLQRWEWHRGWPPSRLSAGWNPKLPRHRSRLPTEAAEQAMAAVNRQIQRLVESVYGRLL
jgi:hypothetical protein